MADMNVVALTGRLTKDATIKEISNSTIYNMSVAVGKRVKRGDEWVDETSFLDVKYFTKSTAIGKYLVKGQSVSVSGSLEQGRWEQDGQTRSRVVISAQSVNLLSRPADNADKGEKGKQPAPKKAKATTPEEFTDEDDDVIPF